MSDDLEKDPGENTSLIEFPCDFPIKVMGLNTPLVRDAIIQAIDAHAEAKDQNGAPYKQDIKEQPSRTGKYVSLTITMHYGSQLELDNVYRRLTKIDGVSMVL